MISNILDSNKYVRDIQRQQVAWIICKLLVAHTATLYSANPTVANRNRLDVC